MNDYDEPEEIQCEDCDLRFYVVASNDAWIMGGSKFQNYCPRCGAALPDCEPRWAT